MITKTVIKDYVAKKCPYLVSLELEDKTLISLLKKSIANQQKYRELAEEEDDNDTDGDDGFDLYETLKDYPYFKKEIEEYEKTIKKNPAEELIEKYNDNQLISKLSREYVKDPSDIVSVGDIVDCYVSDISLEKEKVSLSLFKD